MIVKFKRQSNTILLSIAFTFFITHGCNALAGLLDAPLYPFDGMNEHGVTIGLMAVPTGDSAVIEFVNGEMVVLRDTNLFQVSTNFVLHQAYPNLAGNCWRYDTAFRVLEVNEGIITQQEAVNILDSVSQNTTMWSTVFDMKTGNISVAMGENYDSVHKFRLTLKEKSN